MRQLLFLSLLLLLIGCSNTTDPDEPYELRFSPQTVEIAKWYNNHTSAISITHDHPSPQGLTDQKAQELLKEHNLVMDYELVTKSYKSEALQYIKDNNLGYFGHGNTHDDHDNMSYTEAVQSFSACYDTMMNWELKPISYAYPYGAGRKEKTQLALAKAGFLSGRAFTADTEEVPTYHIMPGDNQIPENWYLLPTLRMENLDFANNTMMINDNMELMPILDESIKKRSWIILTYHSIGDTDGWGYTTMENFIENITSIGERDFWSASMDAITLYTYERAVSEIEISEYDDRTFGLTISDGYENKKFNQPLTVLLQNALWKEGTQFFVSRDGVVLDTIESNNNKLSVNLLPDEKEYLIHL